MTMTTMMIASTCAAKWQNEVPRKLCDNFTDHRSIHQNQVKQIKSFTGISRQTCYFKGV
jgi:hypothetical protein